MLYNSKLVNQSLFRRNIQYELIDLKNSFSYALSANNNMA